MPQPLPSRDRYGWLNYLQFFTSSRWSDLFGFCRYDFVPNSESGVTFVAQVIGVWISAGGMVLDERQPDRLMTGTLKVVFARRVWRQRVPGAVQQAPVGVVERFDEEFTLAGVFGVAGRFVVDKQYLKGHENRYRVKFIYIGALRSRSCICIKE